MYDNAGLNIELTYRNKLVKDVLIQDSLSITTRAFVCYFILQYSGV